MKILLAADDSEFTGRAAQHLVAHIGWFAKPPHLHVLTVHAPMPYSGAVGPEAVHKYHEEECEKVLAAVRAVFLEGGVKFTTSWCAGEPAEEIVAYAEANGIELIVMGSHGHGALHDLALGSVSDEVMRAAKVPVMFVK